MSDPILAFIGGSGLYNIKGLLNTEEIKIDTPFGSPSDLITIGDLANQRVAFLPRHGRNHHLSPTEIPVRANIYALKSIGVKRIVEYILPVRIRFISLFVIRMFLLSKLRYSSPPLNNILSNIISVDVFNVELFIN